jgi:glycine cleavage system H protein
VSSSDLYLDEFGVVESIKAVSDLYAPVSGTVVDTNDALQDTPELINEDPFGDGWLITLDPEGELDQLLTADEYRQQV